MGLGSSRPLPSSLLGKKNPRDTAKGCRPASGPRHVALTRALLSFCLWLHWPSFKLMAKIFIQHRSVECLCVQAPGRCVGLQKHTAFRLPWLLEHPVQPAGL